MRTWRHARLHGLHILDGGLATELEQRGLLLEGPLWSASALADNADVLRSVHREYLDAGAEILLTASYQVSSLGFQKSGLPPERAQAAAAAALRRSVELARQACEEAGRPDVLVGASLGPYGAALANGAEYHGNYGFPDAQSEQDALTAFHRERIAVLAGTDADLLAFETLPSLAEAEAVATALRGFPALAAWCSFTCRDAEHVRHGERLRDCAARLDTVPQVVALGINCTSPAWVLPLIGELRHATSKPVLVYPNSGEGWDAKHRCWTGEADAAAFEALAGTWFAAGAQIVGGCCRTGPGHIRAVAAAARARDARARKAAGPGES